jgi:cytochrome c oxidase assembly protein subunit 11
MLVKLACVAGLMFGFGYAMVPFYYVICEKLGINNLGRPDVEAQALASSAKQNTQVDTTRRVTIELDGNTQGLAWGFRPLTRHVEVHPGELTQVEFEVENTRDYAVAGQAIPAYAPINAAQYFRKLDCFCFAKQTLAAGEKKRMPVVFVIDPALPADVHTITLSYTFFEVGGTAAKRS